MRIIARGISRATVPRIESHVPSTQVRPHGVVGKLIYELRGEQLTKSVVLTVGHLIHLAGALQRLLGCGDPLADLPVGLLNSADLHPTPVQMPVSHVLSCRAHQIDGFTRRALPERS